MPAEIQSTQQQTDSRALTGMDHTWHSHQGNRAEERHSSFSSHQQPSHEQHQHRGQAGSTLSLAGGQRCWVGSEQLPESSHCPVGNDSWIYPKAAGGTLYMANTGRTPHPPLPHCNSWANSFTAGSGKASQALGLIFSTNTAPEVREARAAFLKDRRAGLNTGTLGQGHVWPKRIKASLGITMCSDVPADPSSHSLLSFSRSSTNLMLMIRRCKCTQPCSQLVETSPAFGC